MAEYEAFMDELFANRSRLLRTSFGAFNRGSLDYFRAVEAAQNTSESVEAHMASFRRSVPLESAEARLAYDTAVTACRKLARKYKIAPYEGSELLTLYGRRLSVSQKGE